MQKKPDDSGLRNTIYDQQTRSGRRLTKRRLWLYKMAAPVALALMRGVIGWCRSVRIVGGEHIAAALARSPSFIPVYWHQHQLFCAKYLFEQRAAGVKLGVLISPSVDGEFGAIIVRRLGGEVIRGSSSHTGARALRDFYQALVHDGISPVIAPDGPRGPRWKFKPGALLLAQLSQRPIVPLCYYASRAWQISWDRFVIPKIGARIVIAVGAPVYVPKGLDAPALERLQAEMELTMKALFESAKAAGV
ncbi:MAG TPA: lysophospholipid acyltransferase family protein [Steroidobacteraceae bacterium]|nr:lysophospholipid acyltransferase family protein [Steroidobacteraceae bacterium]